MRRLLSPCATVVGACLAVSALASAPVTDELRRTAIVKAVEKAGPAVVNVSTERIVVVRGNPFGDLFGDMGPDVVPHLRRYRTYSLGSGVIIDPGGYIVTNEHVVQRAQGIFVTLANDETIYKARLIASHPEHDVALIKIDADRPLPAVEFGDSDDLMIGEVAVAIGNSYGLENTVTTGVVSATRRSIVDRGRVLFEDFIQTDAAINPGNSGGALVNIHGRLIGINSAMRYGAENIGFAIPVNKVKQSLEMVLDPRQLKQMWVGVAIDHDEHGRCVVASVDEDSPAEGAGLKPDDVIVAIDDEPIEGAYDYGLSVLKHSPGDTITLTVERGGTQKKFTLTLAAVPKPSVTNLAGNLFGLEVRNLTKDDAAALGVNLDGGVLITAVESRSPAAGKRLRKGDIIVRVDRFSVPDADHLGQLLDRVRQGDEVLFWVVRHDYLIGNYLTAR